MMCPTTFFCAQRKGFFFSVRTSHPQILASSLTTKSDASSIVAEKVNCLDWAGVEIVGHPIGTIARILEGILEAHPFQPWEAGTRALRF